MVNRMPAAFGTLLLVIGGVVGWQLAGHATTVEQVAPASLKDDCGADILLIGARGTGERDDDETVGFGATVLSTEHAMSQAFKPHNVVAEFADFTTLALPTVLFTTGGTYRTTLAAGAESVRDKLEAWAVKCSNYRFVLVGYSLGANVVGDAYAELAASTTPHDRALFAKIAGVALLGDPRLNAADPAVIDPPPDGGEGMFRSWAPFVRQGVRPLFRNADGRVRSWCLPHDYVCDSISASDVDRIPAAWLDGSFAHFHYRDSTTASAGVWLADRARATIAGVPAPAPAPGPAPGPAPASGPASAPALASASVVAPVPALPAPVLPAPGVPAPQPATGHAGGERSAAAPEAVVPPPTGAPATSRPSAAPAPVSTSTRFAVYHTCANGACGLARHTGPGFTAYPRTGTPLVDGDPVDVTCQSGGEPVSGSDGSSSPVWDRLTDSTWVADFYVSTPGTGGAFSASVPRC